MTKDEDSIERAEFRIPRDARLPRSHPIWAHTALKYGDVHSRTPVSPSYSREGNLVTTPKQPTQRVVSLDASILLVDSGIKGRIGTNATHVQ